MLILFSEKVKKTRKLTLEEWIFLLTSIYYLTLTKIKIVFFSFKKLSKSFGELEIKNEINLSKNDYLQSEKIRVSIIRGSRIVPWKSVCLDQAIAGINLLKHKKIPYCLHLGVRKKEDGLKLDAHAWVVCGDKIILGGEKSKFYMVTASYSCNYKK